MNPAPEVTRAESEDIMTRKRFNNLMRYWFFLMAQETKKIGNKPVRTRRGLFDSKIQRGGNYLDAWTCIRNLSEESIKEKLPIK